MAIALDLEELRVMPLLPRRCPRAGTTLDAAFGRQHGALDEGVARSHCALYRRIVAR